jgi:hypothetical protein
LLAVIADVEGRRFFGFAMGKNKEEGFSYRRERRKKEKGRRL